MKKRNYRVVVAATRVTLELAANPPGTFDPDASPSVIKKLKWTILETTIREFNGLDSNPDPTYPDLGSIFAGRPGWVALAYLDI